MNDDVGVKVNAVRSVAVFRYCFTGNSTGGSPGEIVKVLRKRSRVLAMVQTIENRRRQTHPEGVSWKDKVPNRKSKKIKEHPVDVDDTFGLEQDEESRETQDGKEEEERNDFDGAAGETGIDRRGDKNARRTTKGC